MNATASRAVRSRPAAAVVAALVGTALSSATLLGALAAPASADQVQDRLRQPAAGAQAVGGTGRASTSLPVPDGLTPVRLRGQVTAATDSGGSVLVTVGNRTVAELPADTGGSFDVRLRPGDVRNGAIAVGVQNQLAAGAGGCVTDTTSTETLGSLVLGTRGVEAVPTTPGTFLSPGVRAVTVAVGAAAEPAVLRAGLQAVASVVAASGAGTPVDLVLGGGRPAAAPGVRVVALRADDAAGAVDSRVAVVAGVPTLELTGPADQLADAAAALGSAYTALADAPTVAGLAQHGAATTTAVASLADLGAGSPTLAGTGRAQVTVGVPQSAFGGPVEQVSVHLEGNRTPTPAGASATASVLWNGRIVDSQLLGDGHTWAADVTVPAAEVLRDNSLAVRLDAVPAGGRCDVAVPQIQLDVDGSASTVAAVRGQSLAPGFTRFPQVLGGTVTIALGDGQSAARSAPDAAHLVSALQRLTKEALRVDLVTVDAFVGSSRPGIVVGASPAQAEHLGAPLRFSTWRSVDAAGVRFAAQVDGPFAALEAFESGGRDVLMLGGFGAGSDHAVVDGLTGALALSADRTPDGWFGLSGDLFVAQPGGEPVLLATDQLAPQAEVTEEFRTIPAWVWAALGTFVLLVALRGLFSWRRRRTVRALVDAEEAAQAAGDTQDHAEAGAPR